MPLTSQMILGMIRTRTPTFGAQPATSQQTLTPDRQTAIPFEKTAKVGCERQGRHPFARCSPFAALDPCGLARSEAFPNAEAVEASIDTRTGVAMLDGCYVSPFSFNGSLDKLTFDPEDVTKRPRDGAAVGTGRRRWHELNHREDG